VEETLGVEIVVAGLVDHTNLTMPSRKRIGEGNVYLPLFQGYTISCISHAHEQPNRRFPVHKSSGFRPVTFAKRASMRGPISSRS